MDKVLRAKWAPEEEEEFINGAPWLCGGAVPFNGDGCHRGVHFCLPNNWSGNFEILFGRRLEQKVPFGHYGQLKEQQQHLLDGLC